jgi:hypothetical protein
VAFEQQYSLKPEAWESSGLSPVKVGYVGDFGYKSAYHVVLRFEIGNFRVWFPLPF